MIIVSVSSLICRRRWRLAAICSVSQRKRYDNHVVHNVDCTWVTQYNRDWMVVGGWRSGSIVAVHMLGVLSFDVNIGAQTPHIEP